MSSKAKAKAKAQRDRKKGRTKTSAPPKPSAPALRSLLFGGDQSLESWGLISFVLLALTLVVWGVLAARPGGALPIWLYSQGRFFLVPIALGVAVWGLVTVLRRKPVIQHKRLWPLVALAGTIGLAPFPVPYPAPRERAPSHASVRFPLQGSWRVRWAGEGVENNPLVLEPARRFGLVLVREEAGSMLLPGTDPGRPAAPQDHLGFGLPVLSPVDGIIAGLLESLPDDFERRAPILGNYVVIKVAAGEYFWLSGLKRDSVLPETGDRIAAGDPLASVGASAARRPTAEPHLAIFMASSPDPDLAEGIPWQLEAWNQGGRRKGPGMPQGGVDWNGSPRGPVIRPVE